MTMLCRISDERINNPWESIGEFPEIIKNFEEITLSEIMGSDHYVWLRKGKTGITLTVENEEGIESHENNCNELVLDSMASFCRQFLNQYEQLSKGK